VGFRDPVLLAGLLLVPLALLAYLRAQKRRKRYAVRYTNVDVLAAVATRSWTRHLPAALGLLALAALLIALARPERTVADQRRQATVMMVTDTSGSMQATDVAPDRITAAKKAARTLSGELPEAFRLGLVTFGSTAEQQVAPTTDRSEVDTTIARLKVAGATAMGDGLALGLKAAQVRVPDGEGGTQRLPAAIVLLSDGKNTRGENDPRAIARRARQARIPIYTIALGTQSGVLERPDPQGGVRQVPVPPDTATLQEIARITGARYFAAPNAARLDAIYANLGTRLATISEKQEVTAAFAGGGLVLLLAGALASLLRTGRLP
jgi:Ca-activated chloride channel family protein